MEVVSICCIAYNHEKYIGKALDSFLMQKTTFDYEIIVHDDASTDGTASIIKQYEKRYPNKIRGIYQKENQYSKGNKRILLFAHEIANGKYIALCEGDDFWTDENKLQRQVEFMEANKDCGGCFHSGSIIDAKKNYIVGECKTKKYSQKITVEDILGCKGLAIVSSSIMYRKSILNTIPNFFLISPVGDFPLQIIIASNKYAYYMEDNMSAYQINVKNSWTSSTRGYKNLKKKRLGYSEEIIKTLKEMDKYFEFKYRNLFSENIMYHELFFYLFSKNFKVLREEKYVQYLKKQNMKFRIKFSILKYLYFMDCVIGRHL